MRILVVKKQNNSGIKIFSDKDNILYYIKKQNQWKNICRKNQKHASRVLAHNMLIVKLPK